MRDCSCEQNWHGPSSHGICTIMRAKIENRWKKATCFGAREECSWSCHPDPEATEMSLNSGSIQQRVPPPPYPHTMLPLLSLIESLILEYSQNFPICPYATLPIIQSISSLISFPATLATVSPCRAHHITLWLSTSGLIQLFFRSTTINLI